MTIRIERVGIDKTSDNYNIRLLYVCARVWVWLLSNANYDYGDEWNEPSNERYAITVDERAVNTN